MCQDVGQDFFSFRKYLIINHLKHTATPDPHIERWLLLDGSAFKAVFGKGCEAPDQKCDRDRYKQLLIEAIRGTGHLPTLGGIEYAKDILIHMDIHRAARADKSFQRFVEELFNTFGKW